MTETEIKIRWRGTAAEAQELIESRGYRVVEARTLEADQLFDRPSQSTTNGGGELQSSGRALRLRRRISQVAGREDANSRAAITTPIHTLASVTCVVTYKGPAQDGPYKSREEIEFDASDGDVCELVLARLGYLPVFRYEKYRTTFDGGFGSGGFEKAAADPPLIRDGAGVITLDETPIGVFIELEGVAEWIEQTRQSLGFTTEAYVKSSYAALYREYRLVHPDAALNMTFASDRSNPPEQGKP